METGVVAAVQPRWRRYGQESEMRAEMTRFLRLARDKGADVAVFPELTGLMLSGPLAREMKGTLQRKAGFLERLLSSFGGAPELAGVLPMLITEHAEELTGRYIHFWCELAREYRMVIVAGTLLAETEEGVIQHRAGVFDKDGGLLGWQPKLHLTAEESAVASVGDTLTPFDTAFGRLGVLVGNDILFPELARALAYRGCIGILHPTLARDDDAWRRHQMVAKARAQENQLFIAQSFLIGTDDIFVGPSKEVAGRSSVLAPIELSIRGDGVMGMIGAEKVEGVVTGEWNTASLRNLWEHSDVPVRALARSDLFYELLAFDYQSGATIAERTADIEEITEVHKPALTPPPEPADEVEVRPVPEAPTVAEPEAYEEEYTDLEELEEAEAGLEDIEEEDVAREDTEEEDVTLETREDEDIEPKSTPIVEVQIPVEESIEEHNAPTRVIDLETDYYLEEQPEAEQEPVERGAESGEREAESSEVEDQNPV
ncbi:MAG: carbon-nitrogen hydrolase family protein [Chloroflexota bacterium]|nr:carbon-nitrogen hydrolase family protein [Chloroflexota bacterium]